MTGTKRGEKEIMTGKRPPREQRMKSFKGKHLRWRSRNESLLTSVFPVPKTVPNMYCIFKTYWLNLIDLK